ncbi:MAG: DNA-processing protein DprA [bacterium]
MEDREYWLSLNLVPGLGFDKIKKLINVFGSPKNIFSRSEKELSKIIGPKKEALENLKIERISPGLKKELKELEKRKIHYITLNDEGYPLYLKEIANPPLVLYIKGKLLKEDSFSLSIVGARKASSYGMEVAEKFSSDLAKCGFTIVSGLARGIDSAAHYGALKAKGRTIAVLGSGMDFIYPPENRALSENISENGAVISEFPLATRPFFSNFPRRNRIISGLTKGTIVVEAGFKSGSLITAGLALEQGRDVFAVPGKALSDQNKGAHILIKQGAKLTDNIFDVLEEYNIDKEKIKTLINNKIFQVNECEKKIIAILSEEPKHIDFICRETKDSIQNVLGVLTQLELKGLVKQSAGKMFVKKL